jgi:hypothetical protein
LRRLIGCEVQRAEVLLDSGRPLLRKLRGWAQLAVAGYLAGGRAAARSLRRAQWSVLPAPPRRRRRDIAVALIAELTRVARPARHGEAH